MRWAHRAEDLLLGDIAFFLSYGHIVGRELRTRHHSNLIVHAANLPTGRGWSPVTWQILEGIRRITVTLFEADEKVDSGAIYLQEHMDCDDHELLADWRKKLADITISLCRRFVAGFPQIASKSRAQVGDATYYARRGPEDSRLDPDQPIKSQFNLLRVVDNERYPAWFELHGHRYTLQIRKR